MNCPNDAQLWVTSKLTPHGRGSAADAMRAGQPDGAKATFDAQDVMAQENTLRTQLIDELAGVFDNDQPYAEAGKTSSKALQSMARDLTRYDKRLREAQEYQRIQKENWDRDFSILGTMTKGVKSKWLDWTVKGDAFMTNAKALFHKWAMLFAVQPDKSFLDNEFITRYSTVEAKIHGFIEKMSPQLRSFEQWAEPIAYRLGYKPEDMYTMLGDAANAMVAAEKNEYLISKWQQSIRDEMAKPDAKRNLKEIRKWQRRIFDLRTHLEDENPPEELYSAGMTNGQARKLLTRILDEGVTMDEVQEASRRLTDMFHNIYNERLQAGLVPADVHAAMVDLPHYVAYQTKFDNVSGAINDTHAYNPGAYHEMQGSRTAPDSAYWTARSYLRRAATELGTQDMVRMLAAKAVMDKRTGVDNGLRLYSYGQMRHFAKSDNPAIRQWAENFQAQGGFVAYVPTFGKDGTPGPSRRMYVCFDPKWASPENGLTGADLNAAIVAAPKAVSGLTKTMASANSWYGQAFTRFRPVFAPVAGMRDLIERSFHISNADMTASNGSHVAGYTLLPRYFANVIPAADAMLKAMLGRQPQGLFADLWEEYKNLGLRYQRTYGMDAGHRTFDDVQAARDLKSPIEKALGERRMKDLRQNLELAGNAKTRVLSVIDGWNDYFQNIAQFTHYATLRKAGIAPDRAAAQALASMNLYESGSSTPVLRALFPFVKPTLQSSRANLRALGLTYDPRGFAKSGKRGWVYGAGMFATASMLLPLIREGLGDDPTTGESRYDAIPLSMASKMFPIAMGNNGDYFKLQVGYGLPQTILALAIGRDRLSRGKLTLEDYATEMAFSITQNFLPGNWPEFDIRENPFAYLMQAMSPTALEPLAVLATNTTHFGTPISGGGSYSATTPKALQGRSSTPQVYHDAAKWLNREWGVDLAPEQIKAASDELLIGPLNALRMLWDESVKKGSRDIPISERMDPITRMMGGTMLFGSVGNVGRKLFYDAYDDITKQIQRKNIRLQSTEYGRNRAKRIEYQTRILRNAGFDDDFISDYFLLEDTRRQLSEDAKKLNRTTRDMLAQSKSGADFKELYGQRAEEEASIYDDCVSRLNYYRSRR